jgi:hypothetical protein
MLLSFFFINFLIVENTCHYLYMLAKLLVFIGLIALFNMSDSLFEKIFIARPWKFLFVNSDDLISDWRTRWSHDCYSFACGMIFALFVSILKRNNLIDDNNNNNNSSGENGSATACVETSLNVDDEENAIGELSSTTNELLLKEKKNRVGTNGSGGGRVDYSKCQCKKLKFVLVVLSLAGLVGYGVFASSCKLKQECDNYTPYITIIPVLLYYSISYRNVSSYRISTLI